MRYFFQDVFWDGTGGIVPSGTVTVYRAGTTTAANLYAASVGGTATHSVTSNTSGVFSFWVDDADYVGAYKLVLSKTNYETATYDNVVIQYVDQSSAQTLANKTLTLASLTAPTITGPTVTGTVAGGATYTTPTLTSPVINTGVSGSAIDNDSTLAGNSSTKLTTQQAAKTYIDNAKKAALAAAIAYGF